MLPLLRPLQKHPETMMLHILVKIVILLLVFFVMKILFSIRLDNRSFGS